MILRQYLTFCGSLISSLLREKRRKGKKNVMLVDWIHLPVAPVNYVQQDSLRKNGLELFLACKPR